uniref:Helitron helicase-like domain-containing protein n=1 Tax=Amphimedon queenslandica TaxID=400682 RepID=A0A1X7TKF8_AMPQE
MRNIRGSSAYRNKAKLDLFVIFRMQGPPTFFITLSADDMYWFDLMCVLAKCDGKNLSDDEVKELSTSECSKPIGEIKDYFWRVKFQQRGSRHIHSLCWVEDAPDIKTAEGRRKAPGFINKYVSCHVPKDGKDDDLKDLVLQIKKHNHTQTYKKNAHNRCHFDYPKRPSDTTRLKGNADVGNKARFYILKREVGAEMIHPFNPDLPKVLRANMGIQVVGNVYGAAKYVCHYMCKDKPEQIKQKIARKFNKLPVIRSQRLKLLKIGNTNKSQDARCCFCTTGLYLIGSRPSYVFTNTNRPEKKEDYLSQLES